MPKINFTKTLNALIEKKGISNADLKRKIGTNQIFIERLRNGEVNLTLEIMEKIAKKLGCVLKIEFEEVE
ncbi:MAG: helix-turn-helix transcriptional regulator [Candidatus Shapirobacteria bacterium]